MGKKWLAKDDYWMHMYFGLLTQLILPFYINYFLIS